MDLNLKLIKILKIILDDDQPTQLFESSYVAGTQENDNDETQPNIETGKEGDIWFYINLTQFI